MAILELPLAGIDPQTTIGVDINNVSYLFDFTWNDQDASVGGQAWYFDVYTASRTLIAGGLRVVLGVHIGRRIDDDLFRQGAFVAVDTSGQSKEAGIDDIGTRVLVRYIPVNELLVGLARAGITAS